MAPARTKPTRRRARDENSRNLRELAVFLEDGAAFRLGLAMYDVPRTREEWLGRLATELEGRPVHLLRLDLSHEPGETLLLRRLEEILRIAPVPEGKTPAVMVTGLEAAMDFRPMPGTLFVEGGDLLRNANLQRDAFPERCPAPVVIWLNSAGTTAFTQTAPDLAQWCTGFFEFAGRESGRAELEKRLISSPLIETERLSHEAKRERIGLLQGLLRDLEKSPQREVPGTIARRAALHYELGHVFLGLSQVDAALEHFEGSLSLARSIGDWMMEVGSLGSLGNAWLSLGKIDRAIDGYQKALEQAELHDDRRWISIALGNLGIAHARRGELDRALDFLKRDLEISSQAGDLRGTGQTINNIGVILIQLDRCDEALAYLEQALEIAGMSNDPVSIGGDLSNPKITPGVSRRDAKGRRDAEGPRAEVRAPVERDDGTSDSLQRVGVPVLGPGPPGPIGLVSAPLRTPAPLRDTPVLLGILNNLGSIYSSRCELTKALTCYEEALEVARKLGDRSHEGRILNNLGWLHVEFGQVDRGVGMLERAVQIGREIHDPEILRSAERNLREARGLDPEPLGATSA